MLLTQIIQAKQDVAFGEFKMTFIKSEYQDMSVALIKTNSSGNLSLNDIIDINTSPIYNNISGITINSNNIVLESGHYMIECFLGINNSNLITNYANWNITVDNVEQDTPGSSTQDNKVGIDASVTAISFIGSKTIRIKITDVGGTCSVDNDFSYLIIRKVEI